MAGASLHGVGVEPLLDAIVQYLPSPAERPQPTLRLPHDTAHDTATSDACGAPAPPSPVPSPAAFHTPPQVARTRSAIGKEERALPAQLLPERRALELPPDLSSHLAGVRAHERRAEEIRDEARRAEAAGISL